MSVLDRIAGRLGYMRARKAGAALPAWLSATAEVDRYSLVPLDTKEAHADLYRKLSWVQSAVSRVAQAGAVAEFNVRRRDKAGADDLPNHPFELLLARPNPMQSRHEFLEATLAYHALGEAFWFLNRTGENAPPSELWVIPSHHMRAVPDGKLFLRGYLYDPGDGREIPLEPWQVVHFKRFNPSTPYEGLSPLDALRDAAVADLAMQRWNRNYFDRDHAKIPGALAFSDPVDDDAWAQIKADVRREHGGTNRSLMMLRNAGRGGVQWVSMALSQRDMEFLAGRTFNREEIFGIFAPGLASILSVNATEANAIAGRRTFIEMAVWPALTVVAEKVTNDLLPAYGDGLVGEFADIRPTDRAMALSEQAAAEKVQTIDELRSTFYDLPPIGDERGKLLPAEVTHGLTLPEPEPAPTPPQLLPFTGQEPEPDDGEPGDTEEPEDESTPALQGTEAAKAAERKALRKWLRNRPHADPAKFSARLLDVEDVAAVVAGMRREGGTEQPPFGKASTRELPGADGADRQRLRLERKHTTLLARALHLWRLRIIPAGTTPESLQMSSIDTLAHEHKGILRDALYQMLFEAAMLGLDVGEKQVALLVSGVKAEVAVSAWDTANADVINWLVGGQGMPAYVDTLADGVVATTVRQAAPVVAEWARNGQPLTALVTQLESSGFSPARASRIVTTEVTRAYAEGNTAAWQASGVVERRAWATSADEAVCPICGGLNGKEAEFGKPFSHEGVEYSNPPAHANCRCWLLPVMDATQRELPVAPPVDAETLRAQEIATLQAEVEEAQRALNRTIFAGNRKEIEAAEARLNAARRKLLDANKRPAVAPVAAPAATPSLPAAVGREGIQSGKQARTYLQEHGALIDEQVNTLYRQGRSYDAPISEAQKEFVHTRYARQQLAQQRPDITDVTELARIDGELARLDALVVQQEQAVRTLQAAQSELFTQEGVLRAAFKTEVKNVVQVAKPTTIRPESFSKKNPFDVKPFNKGFRAFERLVDERCLPPGSPVLVGPSSEARSYYNGVVRLYKKANSSTVVHETGHWLENNQATVKRQATEFLERRTRGESAQWLRGNYDRDEVAKFDRFIDPYMGRIYEDGNTEIISMGLQYLHENPVELLQRDPEYFEFIWNITHGVPNP